MNTKETLFATIAGFLFYLLWFCSGREIGDYIHMNLSSLPLVLTAWLFSWLEKNRWWIWLWFHILFWREEEDKKRNGKG